jgi:uncharacterized protein YndB with AHSA1/START domain
MDTRTMTMPLGAEGVRLARLLPGPIERVWTFLTDSDKRATWLAAGSFDLRPGGRIELNFDNDSLSPGAPAEGAQGKGCSSWSGHITRIEPPHVLAFTSDGMGSASSEVTFELTPQDGKVLLVVTHRRLDDRNARVSVASGWDAHVGILAARLAGATPEPFWPTHARLARDYATRIR